MTVRPAPHQTAITAARRRAWAELARRLLAPPSQTPASRGKRESERVTDIELRPDPAVPPAYQLAPGAVGDFALTPDLSASPEIGGKAHG